MPTSAYYVEALAMRLQLVLETMTQKISRKCTATSVNSQAIFPVWRLWMHLQPLSPAINVVKWATLVRHVPDRRDRRDRRRINTGMDLSATNVGLKVILLVSAK